MNRRQRWSAVAAFAVMGPLATGCRDRSVLMRLGDKSRFVLWNPFRDRELETWTIAHLHTMRATCKEPGGDERPSCPILRSVSAGELDTLSLVDRVDGHGETVLHYALGASALNYPLLGLFVTVRAPHDSRRDISSLNLVR